MKVVPKGNEGCAEGASRLCRTWWRLWWRLCRRCFEVVLKVVEVVLKVLEGCAEDGRGCNGVRAEGGRGCASRLCFEVVLRGCARGCARRGSSSWRGRLRHDTGARLVPKVVEDVRKVAFVSQDYSLQPRHGQSSHAYRSNAFRETS